MLAFFGIFLTLIIAINLGKLKMAEATTCCLTKKVGSVTYTLISHRDTSSYNCLTDCIYRTSDLGSLYCFSSGTEESECITTTATTASITTTMTTTTTTSTINSPDASRTTSPLSITTDSANPWFVNQTLFTLETIAESGTWGPDEFCPEAAYASAFQLYVAPLCTRRCYTDDDVALMGIKLYCSYFTDPYETVSEITSSVMGPCEKTRGTCEWMAVRACPESQFLTSSRYLSEYFHYFAGEPEDFTCPPGRFCQNETIAGSDPKGGLNIDMSCTDGTELPGEGIMPEEVPLTADGEVTTFWSEWNKCPAGFAICGIRSKVHQGETDKISNMGHTEVLFHCCQLPPGFTG